MNIFKFENKRKKNYFEGWYVRILDEEKSANYGIIFAMTTNVENPHSFIQIFNENDEKPIYLKFPISDFSYNLEKNEVSIGENILSPNGLYIKSTIITIDVTFENHDYIQNYKGIKSAMGILKKAPLECFQEVIFLKSKVIGTISIVGINININGISYMEKTYGTKFPQKWIWIQSNTTKLDAAISFSVGKIPIGPFKINGFLSILRIGTSIYHFSSTKLSRIKVITLNDKQVIMINHREFRLILNPELNDVVKLVGPNKKGVMDLDVFESLNSKVKVTLYKNTNIIFEEEFTNVGMEQMYTKKGE